MKKKLFALIVPLMMVGTLTGCGESGKYNDFCAKAADTAPLLLNSKTGKEIYTSEESVRELEDYNSVLALNTYTFQGKELKITWEFLPKEKWVISTYALDATRSKVTPTYGKEAFDATAQCIVSYVEGGKSQGKTVLNWKFSVAKTEVVERTLKQIDEDYVKNGFKLGDMGKNAEGKDTMIGTRGYITSTFEQPDHTYAGVFISDGEHSLQLYAGQISNLWKENNLKTGDCIFVVGPLQIYQGFIEMSPTMMEPIDAKAYSIADPVTTDLTNKQWDSSVMLYQSSLVTLSNCTYSSGADKIEPGSTKHATVAFKHGEDTINVYCSYHLGEKMSKAVKELILGATKEDGTEVPGLAATDMVTIKGILTFADVDTPEIIPIFGAASFVKAA